MGDVSADAGGELETVAQGRTVRISSETDVNETSVIRVSGTVQTAEAED
jgi:hypothetical protein